MARDNKAEHTILLEELEKTFNIGPSSGWSNADFIALSNYIFDKTKIRINKTTLRRFVDINEDYHPPRPSTLDAIAKYLGYKGRYQFIGKHKLGINAISETPSNKEVQESIIIKEDPKQKKISNSYVIYVIIGISVVTILTLLTITFLLNKPISRSDFTFSTFDTVGPVPLSVRIDYDISKLPGNDYYLYNFEIKESNVSSKGIPLDKKKKSISTFLRSPRNTTLELRKKDKTIAYFNVVGTYPSWTITFKGKEGQFQDAEKFTLDSILNVPENSIKEEGVIPFKGINYQYSMPINAKLSDFTIETRLKYNLFQGNDICAKTYVTIMGINSGIYFPLCHKNCIKNLTYDILNHAENLVLPKYYEENNTWSSETWGVLKVFSGNDSLKVMLNDKVLINEKGIPNDNLELVHNIRFFFTVNGSIDYVKVWDGENNIIYFNDFNAD